MSDRLVRAFDFTPDPDWKPVEQPVQVPTSEYKLYPIVIPVGFVFYWSMMGPAYVRPFEKEIDMHGVQCPRKDNAKASKIHKFGHLTDAEKVLLGEVMASGESLSNGYVSEETWHNFLKSNAHSASVRRRLEIQLNSQEE